MKIRAFQQNLKKTRNFSEVYDFPQQFIEQLRIHLVNRKAVKI